MINKKQLGSVLIIVLIIVFLMSAMSTLIIKKSLIALQSATSHQVQQLLLQDADAAIFHLEDPKTLQENLTSNGVLNFVLAEHNWDKELVFCYQGKAPQLYTMNQASVIQITNDHQIFNHELGHAGYCRIDQHHNFFSSDRKVVMTQIALRVNADHQVTSPFTMKTKSVATQIEQASQIKNITMIVTSSLPAMSSASDNEINLCFSTHMNQIVSLGAKTALTDIEQSVSQCLQQLGIPVHTQRMTYQVVHPPNGDIQVIAQGWFIQ